MSTHREGRRFSRDLPSRRGWVYHAFGADALQTLTYKGVVYPWHCDQMGHMNVMWYTGKFDEATWNLLAELGLGRSYMEERNCGMVAVQQNTSYKKELVAGDLIEIRSAVLEVREKVIRFQHEMRNTQTGEVAALTELTGVHLDRKTRRSCPLPDNARAAAAARI
ncbi:MAG: acyl-CoA thioesterase [Acidobacteria bacterium]|nr:acyl-CoA thioesterase [Acidobacteriota bacterium]MBV9145570.1 acyl-CoA thioesterase [Acidobacteriota bacterium]